MDCLIKNTAKTLMLLWLLFAIIAAIILFFFQNEHAWRIALLHSTGFIIDAINIMAVLYIFKVLKKRKLPKNKTLNIALVTSIISLISLIAGYLLYLIANIHPLINVYSNLIFDFSSSGIGLSIYLLIKSLEELFNGC